MTLDNIVSALQELKGWTGLPYCIEEPMGIEGLGVVTEDLIENLITLVRFVEDLPSYLEQCKEKMHLLSVAYDSDVFDGAINQGLDRAISHVEDFVKGLENPEAPVREKPEDKDDEEVELVIRLPKDKYDAVVKMYRTFPVEMREQGLSAIKNGDKLPEDHGRLGDLDALEKEMEGGINAGLMIDGYEDQILNTKIFEYFRWKGGGIMSYNKPDCTGCPYAGNILMIRPPECPDAYAKVAPMCGIYPHKEDLASEEVHRRRQDRK